MRIPSFASALAGLLLVACTTPSSTKKIEARPLAELFPGPMPVLPPPLAGLSFGKALPPASGIPGVVEVQGGISRRIGSPEWPGIDFALEGDPELRQVRVYNLPAGHVDVLTAAWGEPAVTRYDHVWWNPEQRIRVQSGLTVPSLSFHAYLPLVTLLGAKDAPLGFQTAAILGATPQEVRASYPRTDDWRDGVAIVLLPTEWGLKETRVRCDEKLGKIQKVTVPLDYIDDATRARVLATLEAKYGPGTPDPSDKWTVVFRAAGPRVTAVDVTSHNHYDLVVEL